MATIVLAAAGRALHAAPPTSRPAGRVVPFAAGIRIDWSVPRVEIDAVVVQRDVYLEVLACAPQTKEHESILQTRARPLHIYQALGLIGLPDGAPPRFDPRAGRAVPPRGTPVDLRLRYELAGRERIDDARDWLRPSRPDNRLPPVAWYYVGAAPAPRQPFGADIYGTVAVLMPFNNALLLLARSGSVLPATSQPVATSGPAGDAPPDDSQYLNLPDDWSLSADPRRVPPIGTRVTLLVSRRTEALNLRLDRFGRVLTAGRELSLDAAVKLASTEPGRPIVIEVEPFSDGDDEQELLQRLAAAGVTPDQVTRVVLPPEAFPENDSAAAAALLVHQFELHRELWRDMSAELTRVGAEFERRRAQLAESLNEARRIVAQVRAQRGPATTQPAPSPPAR